MRSTPFRPALLAALISLSAACGGGGGGGGPVVTVSPANPGVVPGGTLQFAASVTGVADGSVTWSVQEGAAGGSISPSGLYAAPAVAGVFHVVATSVASPSSQGSTAAYVVA